MISVFLSVRYGSVPAAHHVPVPVSSHSAAVLWSSYALPRSLHLLHQPIRCRHRGSQCDGRSCLHPLHNLPAPTIPRKPEPELALPAQLIPLPPVLWHWLRFLPVLHGSHRRHGREHGRRAFAHPYADFLHGSRRNFGVRRWSRRSDWWQRWRGGWRKPQQLAKCHEHTRTNGRVRLEALLRKERTTTEELHVSVKFDPLHWALSYFHFSQRWYHFCCLNIVQCISQGFVCFKTELGSERKKALLKKKSTDSKRLIFSFILYQEQLDDDGMSSMAKQKKNYTSGSSENNFWPLARSGD